MFYLFSVIFIIIAFFIFLIGLYFIPSSKIHLFIKSMTTIFLKLCRFKSIHYSSLDPFYSSLKSDKPLIIVSNHNSIFDGPILLSALGNITFVVNEIGSSLFPGINYIYDKLHFIKMKTSSRNNTTQKIIDYTNSRISNQPILTIFPDACNIIPPGKNIAPFSTGAFVGKFDILPIIIKYKNFDIYPYYYDNDLKPRGIKAIFEKLLENNCEIHLHMLPIQKCDPTFSIQQYRDHVYNLMNTYYDSI